MIAEFDNTMDWLSEVGEGVTKIIKNEDVEYNGKQLTKFEFETARGCGSGLYRNGTPALRQLFKACNIPIGQPIDTKILVGKKFWGVWGARIGGRDGYTYADLVSAHAIPADAVEWRSIPAERWADMGRDTDGIKLADKQKTANAKPVAPAPQQDDDFPF